MKIRFFLKKIRNRIRYYSQRSYRYIFYDFFTIYLKHGYKLASFEEVCSFCNDITSPDCDSTDIYTTIGGTERISRDLPITLNHKDKEIFIDAIRQMNTGLDLTFSAPFIACLHNSDILGKYCILRNRNDYIITDSTWSPQHLIDSGIFDKPLKRVSSYLQGEYVLLGMHWWDEYYHWMIEILPRLALIQGNPDLEKLPLLLPGSLKKFHHESLELLNLSNRLVEISSDDVTKIEKLYFLSPLSPTANPSSIGVNWLQRSFQFLKYSDRPDNKIYISRSDANRRQILNEEEITPFLESLGFSIICPSEYSLKEQIQLFKSASLVIGSHGAGLSCIAFMKPATKVIEIFPESKLYVGCYWSLANLCKLQYYALIGSKILNIHGDFKLPLESLEEFLKNVPF